MRHQPNIKKASMLYSIGVVGFFSALHVSMASYYNSSFLSTFTDEKTVSLIYLIISIVTIIGFLSINRILLKLGNFKTSIILILIQIVVFYGIIISDSFKVIMPLFILGMSIISLIALNIDIFLQKDTDIDNTGGIRGLYMTVVNTAWILGPLLGGLLISGNNYKGLYIASFSLLFPLLYVIHKNFDKFKDFKYVKISGRETIVRVLKNKDISKIFFINIILQTFYAWMVIYTPIYLYKNIGFNWGEISIIFTIMLLPFILVELPLGKLADKKYGEKEIMALGFFIIGISTSSIIFFTEKNLIVWAIILFMTRVGAAAAEVMIETYFFKKIDGRDPEILSLFRATRPISFFTAPLLTTIGLVYTTDKYLFLILGILCLITIYPILKIKDTN